MIAWTHGRIAVLGAALALAGPVCSRPAEASWSSRHGGYAPSGHYAARVIYAGASNYSRYRAAYRSGYSTGGLQCVPFARENTGIELAGNAANWWDNAAGVYERGGRPEVGSILNFRATGRMHMGHVAVVSNVINSRNVQIDHANWSGRGVVTRNVTVVDVSPGNDWSAVRVALGTGDFGSIYPTYGFIYDRPDKGMMVANSGIANSGIANSGVANSVAPRAPAMAFLPSAMAASAPVLDLRPRSERVAVLLAPQQDEEVAEAADDAGSARGRRGYARPMPIVHYGRGSTQVARHGAGHLMGGRVLFVGAGPSHRSGREPAYAAGGRQYASLVRMAGARSARAETGGVRAPTSRASHGQAEPGSHRRGRRA